MKRVRTSFAACMTVFCMVSTSLATMNSAYAGEADIPLTTCVASGNAPFSSREDGPGGIDVEVARELGRRLVRPVALHWVQIPNRGGLGKALRHSLGKGACDLFLGIPVAGEANEDLVEQHLIASSPYVSASYVLATKPNSNIKAISDLGNARRVGAVSATPADLYLYQKALPRVPYGSNADLLKALGDGEIDAALVWSPSLARLAMVGVPSKARVREAVPGGDLSTRFVIALRPTDAELVKRINSSLEAMHADGFVTALLNRYGVGDTGLLTH